MSCFSLTTTLVLSTKEFRNQLQSSPQMLTTEAKQKLRRNWSVRERLRAFKRLTREITECVAWHISFFVPTRISTMVSKSFRCARFFLDVMLTWAAQPLEDIMVVQLFSKMDGLFLLLDLQYTETYLHRPHKSERYGLRVDHRRRSSAKLAPKSQPTMSMRMRNDDHSTGPLRKSDIFQTCSIGDPLTPCQKRMGPVRITSWNPLNSRSIHRMTGLGSNRPFAQLLPGLETGHPWRSVNHLHMNRTQNRPKRRHEKQLSARRKHWYHMQVTDRPSPDTPFLTQAIIVQMVYFVWTLTELAQPLLTKKKITSSPPRSAAEN